LDEVFERHNFEVPNDWYKIKPSLFNTGLARTIVHNYGGYWANTLETLYPEFIWEIWEFLGDRMYWREPNMCRKFLRWLQKESPFLNATPGISPL